MSAHIRNILACAALAAIAMPVMAEDLTPPNWRGNPGTSWVQWEFLAPDNPAIPNAGYLPFGPPLLQIIPGPGAGWHAQQPTWALGGPNIPLYNPEGPSGDGWWNLSGELFATLQNSPVTNPHKEIWIQLTWEPQAPGNVPVLNISNPLGPDTEIPLVHQVLWAGDTANPWRQVNYDIYHFDISPNPLFETIHIRGGINIDELVIDTWCVPEPATMSLLVIGGLALLKRRRHR